MRRPDLIKLNLLLGLALALPQSALAAQLRLASLPAPSAEVIPLPPVEPQSRVPLAALMLDDENKNAHISARQLSIDIRPRDIREGKPAGEMPPDIAASALANENCPTHGKTRDWPCTKYCLEAPALCHNPIYFEEENLERYGCSRWGRAMQPLVSAGHFFFTIPFLPYKVAAQPPRTLIATPDRFQAGTCQSCTSAPGCSDRPRFSFAGAAAEAVVVGGLFLLIP